MIELNSKNVGVTLMAYSRPDHLRSVLEGIKNCGIRGFSVYIDGADDRIIREKQSEIHSTLYNIDWAEVRVVQRRVNLGLRRSIISAISEQLERYEQIILLEDDCVPMPEYFSFMFKALSVYKNRDDIRSICGYQLPIVSDRDQIIKAFCLSRFIPWGWATWRDKWQDYNTDFRTLVESTHRKGIYSSLPSDIKECCESEDFLNGYSNTWSLNWVLAHYLSNTFVIYPSRTLIANIGFDGTGVHCYKSDSFIVDSTQPCGQVSLGMDPNITINHTVDRKFNDYMQQSWKQTMEPSTVTESGPLADWQIGAIVSNIIAETQIIDFHTHLFPPSFKDYFLSGPDELLTYHYLTTEALTLTGDDPKKFFSMGKKQQASYVWEHLFVRRTPVSEAARGVITVLDKFNIKCGCKPYQEIRNDMLASLQTADNILRLMNVEKVAMTNDPFDKRELSLLSKSDWDRSKYYSTLRLDQLFSDRQNVRKILSEYGFLSENEKLTTLRIKEYLDFVTENKKSVYAALSLDGDQLMHYFSDPIMLECIIPWLQQEKLPLVLMLGVKRGVNPNLKDGGDGMGGSGLDELENILKNYPNLKILVAHLRADAQHHLTVLARKFPNLKLFGNWWFMNQPKLVYDNLHLRLDLLGTNFIAHHSDARVMEQLIYKWEHFKEQLHVVLTERYRKLNKAGWPVDREMIKNDVRALLYDNSKEALSVKNDKE